MFLQIGFLLLGILAPTIAINDERYLLSSNILPEDLRLVPAVGNGHVATQVFSDTVYMNGLMNGHYDNSHRARIPSTAAFNITIDGSEETSFKLDMYQGVFYKDIDHLDCSIQQRIYAHRVKTRLIINEFTVTRKNNNADIRVNLWSNQGPESQDITFTTLPHSKDSFHMYGLTKEAETNTSGSQMVNVFYTKIPDSVTLRSNEGEMTWTYTTSISPVRGDAMAAYIDAVETPHTKLLQTHVEAWHTLWQNGRIDIKGNVSLAQVINACFFHIMISTPDTSDPVNPFAGLSPGGLARGGKINPNRTGGPYNDYTGHVFWDMDTWILPPVLMLHPEKVDNYLDSRLRVFSAVKDRATNTGYEGVRFPWEQGWTGYETCPWPPASEFQIHVNADVSYAIRQYLYSTGNTDFLIKHGAKEMVMEIARFWKSRSVDGLRNGDIIREIYGVMGPDEYHFNVNNSVFTNYNAKLSMEMPAYLKNDLNIQFTTEEEAEIEELERLARPMLVLFDEELEFHPQFDGFDAINDVIKQSDVVLLGYPLMMNMTPTVRENDLVIYENLTDQFGPDTGTWSMHTVGWLELGHPEKAEEMFYKMFRNIQGPFLIFSEKPANSADGMRAVNFITGMGGLLQSVIFGYGSVRVRMYQVDLLTPYLLPYAESWDIIGFDYRGSTLDFQYEADTVHITLKSQIPSADKLFYVRHADGTREEMKVDRTMSMAPQKLSLVVESDLDKADIPPGEVVHPTTPSPSQAPLLLLSNLLFFTNFVLNYVVNIL